MTEKDFFDLKTFIGRFLLHFMIQTDLQNSKQITRILVVDVAYASYRAYYAQTPLSYQGLAIGAFFGFVKTVLSLIKTYQPKHLIFANDRKERTWRHQIYPAYKAQRPQIAEDFLRQIPLIWQWCQLVTSNTLQQVGFEADDLIASVCQSIDREWLKSTDTSNLGQTVFSSTFLTKENAKQLVTSDYLDFSTQLTEQTLTTETENSQIEKTQKLQIYIFSADQDLYQVLALNNNYREIFFIPTQSKQELFSLENFRQKYQLEPDQWPDYKALVGDHADNLPGLKGFGPKTSSKILRVFLYLQVLFEFLNYDYLLFAGNLQIKPQSYLNLDFSKFLNLEIANIQKFIDTCVQQALANKKTLSDSKHSLKVHFDSYTASQFLRIESNYYLIQKLLQNKNLLQQFLNLVTLQTPKVHLDPSGFCLEKSLSFLEKYQFKSLIRQIEQLTAKNQDILPKSPVESVSKKSQEKNGQVKEQLRQVSTFNSLSKKRSNKSETLNQTNSLF